MPATTIDLCKLADFILGNLSPEDSVAVYRELERNPEALRNLEIILKVIAHCDTQCSMNNPDRLPPVSSGKSRE